MTSKVNALEKENSRKPLGIYIHVPFCESKCGYCGFYSHKGTLEDYEEYTEKAKLAIRELAIRGTFKVQWESKFCGEPMVQGDTKFYGEAMVQSDSFYVDSIFFGGGTPSILLPAQIESILKTIDDEFDVAENVEITLEANPGTLTLDKLKSYKDMGINRLSLGVQSFNDDELKFIGRIHDSKTAKETFELCRKIGFENINLDLIFSLPGQEFEGWCKNLQQAAILGPEHLSVYGLQLEESTDFFRRFQEGEFSETTDEVDRKMYHWTCEFLRARGFEHYEISNWAKPGFECRHNLKYWNFQDYLGIGPSAASFVNGIRFSVGENWEITDVHNNDLKDSAGEFCFTALRISEGIDFEKFEDKIGVPFWSVYKNQRDEIQKLVSDGLVDVDSRGVRLTERGIDISNGIMAMFV